MSTTRDNIFKDVRFWVAQRIPSRDHFISLIREGGGIIVPLEKHADMLIADDARKDAPPGSYSWKFIQDSAKNGIIQLKDRYEIGRNPKNPRPVASGGVTRSSRVEYTAADDAALVRWVLSHTHNRTGNVIYQEFEQQNPRHTWQSWQNRWRKKLQYLSHDQLERIAGQSPEDPAPQPEPEAKPEPEPQPPPAPVQAQRRTRKQVEESKSAPPPEHQPGAEVERPTMNVQAHKRAQPQPAPQPEEPEPEPEEQDVEPLAEPNNNDIPPDSPMSTPPHSNAEEETDPKEIMMARFYDDLKDYAELTESDITLEPTIGGQRIRLWDLAQSIVGQKVPVEDIEWHRVAADLGYDYISEDLADEIEACWERNLMEFMESMAEFEEEEEQQFEDAAEEVAEVEVIPQTAEEDAIPSIAEEQEKEVDGVEPQLPPASKKRSFDAPFSSNPPGKRPRLDRNAVIPSTPEHRLRTTRSASTQQQQQQQQSPSARRLHTRRFALTDTIKDTQDDTQDKFSTPPAAPAIGVLSPDLGSDEKIRTPPLQRKESTFDITPSQQLHIETSSPIVHDRRKLFQRPPTSSEEEAEMQSRRQLFDPLTPTESTAQPAKKRRALPPTFRESPIPRPSPTLRSRRHVSENTDTTARQPRREEVQQQQQQQHEAEERGSPNRGNPRSGNREPETVEDWIEYYQSFGYSHSTIVKAMNATTLVPGSPITTVLESLSAGTGIPSHHEGIWTERDDNSLRLIMSKFPSELQKQPSDPLEQQQHKKIQREINRLDNKHGAERMELRWRFLKTKDGYENRAAELRSSA